MTARYKAVALALALTASGCGDILEVDLPGATPADAMDDPTYSELLVVSAQGDFECAASNYAFIAGHLSGELIGAQSALVYIPYQRRLVRSIDQPYGEEPCTGSVGLYTPLSTARYVAEDAYKRISGYTDAQVANRTRLLGRAALYAGYSFTLFAEGLCQSTFDLGPALDPPAVFKLASDRFTTAIEHATAANDAETLNTALVGRARVRMALGETAGAVADAKRVPAGFLKTITRSNAATSRQNDIYMENVRNRGQSIDPAFWNVTWAGVPDPRVRVTKTGTKGIDGLTDLYLQTKYTSEAAPIRLASYTEAQLIIAEVEGGQTAVGIINALHTAAGIPPFQSTDPAAIRAQVIEERRREFFLEGRRLGDLRRFGGFEQAAGGRHPFVGDVYGLTQCLPIPDVERKGNPNFTS
jgi:starch-binding outer membrane protein, SusD/RagB family